MRFSLGLSLALLGAFPSAALASNNSLLSVKADGTLLLVANTDNNSVSVVDTKAQKTLREIPVGKKPEGVAFIGNTAKGIVTAYDDDEVLLFDTKSGKVLERIATEDEPYGVVVDKAGKFAYVTNDYPGLITEIDLTTNKVARKIPVGKFIRGIAFTPDESQLMVTGYYTAELFAVDRKSGKVVDQWPGIKADNLARQVAVHPTFPFAYVPHIRSRTERAHGAGSIFPYLSVIDLVPKETSKRRRHTIAMDSYNGVIVTANPWETAISPDGRRNYTIYAGTNDMNVSEVANDGYAYIKPVGRLVRLGNNPRAVAVSPDNQTVYIYNFLDFSVAFYQAYPFTKLTDVKVCDPPYSDEIVRGKALFNVARNPMTRLDWISCSSCHPDGDHDGRTWQNPEGLRRTTHFFGMANTYPIHWSADRDEMQDFEHTIRGPLMQGSGLIRGKLNEALGEPNAGRSADLDALAEYCNLLEPTLSPHAAAPGKLTEQAERGKAIFFAKETGCATCHSGPYYTDSSLEKPFKLHDVGTGNADPSEKMGPKYDTPSLLRVYRSTEYLHHGKAKTLEEVFTTYNPKDQHGKTSHLSKDQVADLVAFLKSLPYEKPGK